MLRQKKEATFEHHQLVVFQPMGNEFGIFFNGFISARVVTIVDIVQPNFSKPRCGRMFDL